MSFYTDVIQKDPRFHATTSIRDVALLEPVTRVASQKLIQLAKERTGIELFITETYRSAERQLICFETGLSDLKEVGVHHYGLAFDVAKLVNGRAFWGGDWTFIVPLAKECGLISGVDWNTPPHPRKRIDSDHLQRCSIARQPALFAGTWYPESTYDPYADSLPLPPAAPPPPSPPKT